MNRPVAAALLLTPALLMGSFTSSAESVAGKRPRSGVFTIINDTEWTIHEIRLTPAEEDDWSDNRIKGKPLAKGARVKLEVSCDEQDVRLVDAKGRTCTSESMYPCEHHRTWTLTPQELRGCKDFGR
jgi:hypothetical protein